MSRLAEESAKIGVLMGEEFEKNPTMQPADPVSQGICDGYDEILKKESPDGYEVKAISRKQTTSDDSCTTTTLWGRFEKSIKKQDELFQSGRITKEKLNDYMILSTQLGEFATTDLLKACEALKNFDSKLAAE